MKSAVTTLASVKIKKLCSLPNTSPVVAVFVFEHSFLECVTQIGAYRARLERE